MREIEDRAGAAFVRIVEDDHSRRELLWLDAQHRDDPSRARQLEARDPSLRARLWFFHDVRFDELDAEPFEARLARYGALYDAHLGWLLGEDAPETPIDRPRLAS